MEDFREPIDDLWPFRPRPIADESFSSWFCRTAWANALKAAELYAMLLPGGRLFRLDLDRFAESALIENLSAHTGIPPDDLLSRTFRSWAGRVFERDDGRVKLSWLPPAGLHHSNRSFGQQLCPQCLREADPTYYMKNWRLAFVTSCETHGSLLLDRCPICATSFQRLFAYPSAVSMSVCWKCGFDVRNTLTEHIRETAAQATLLNVVSTGWGEMGDYGPVHALSYFRILWTVVGSILDCDRMGGIGPLFTIQNGTDTFCRF